MVIIEILGAWLLADFLSGVVHWAEDRLLTEETRFDLLNSIKADNDLHHQKPAALTRYSYWENISTTAPLSLPLAMALYYLGAHHVFWLAAFFGTFANLIHRLSHTPPNKLPIFIQFLQFTGLFISFEHHHKHHYSMNGIVKKEDASIRYCPMTNWLNPILDYIGFFPGLERLLGKKE